MNIPINIAMIGYGKIAKDQHVPAIAADPRLRLAAVVSQHGDSPPGVPVFREIGELLASGIEIHAVTLCNRPGDRSAAAFQALDAGWHVMMEKPPALGISEARAMLRRAEELGLTLFTTWHAREHDAVGEARRRLAGETVEEIDIRWCEDVRKWHPDQKWIWEPGGFGVFDPGINALSILTHILPEPVWPAAVKLIVPAGSAMPSRADIELAGRGRPRIGQVLFDWSPTPVEQWDIDVRTSRSLIALRSGGSRLIVDGDPLIDGSDREYSRLYERFARLLDRRETDVDLAPLELVADMFLLARR